MAAICGMAVLLGVGAVSCSEQPRAQERQEALTAATSIVTLPIQGMSCGSCVASVKRTVKALDGVTNVEVSLAERQARISYDKGKISPDQIAAAIRELGYRTGPPVREAGK
jgi:copper ion binding protein